MAVEEFPHDPDHAESERQVRPQYVYHPMLRGFVPASIVPLQGLFESPVTYADTATRRQVRQLQEETELFVATYGEEQLDITEVEAYLRDSAGAERAGRIARAFTKVAVYMTGGFGGRMLLEEIRDTERRANDEPR